MAVVHRIQSIPFEGDVVREVTHASDGSTIHFESGKKVFLHTYVDNYTTEDYDNDNLMIKRNNTIEKLTKNT